MTAHATINEGKIVRKSVPEKLNRNERCALRDWKVYQALVAYTEENDGEFPPKTEFARQLGIHPSALHEVYGRLVIRGVLRSQVVPRGRIRHSYKFTGLKMTDPTLVCGRS